MFEDGNVRKLVKVYPFEGKYEACFEGDVGAALVGRGCSPLEAVGDLCMQRQLVVVRCEPRQLTSQFKIDGNSEYALTAADRRD